MGEIVKDFNIFIESFIKTTWKDLEKNIWLYYQVLFSAFLIKNIKFDDDIVINEMWQCILLEHEHSVLWIIGSLENWSLTWAYTILRKLIENGLNIFLLCEDKKEYINRAKQFNNYIDAVNYDKAKNSNNLEVQQVSKNIENRHWWINGIENLKKQNKNDKDYFNEWFHYFNKTSRTTLIKNINYEKKDKTKIYLDKLNFYDFLSKVSHSYPNVKWIYEKGNRDNLIYWDFNWNWVEGFKIYWIWYSFFILDVILDFFDLDGYYEILWNILNYKKDFNF